MQRQKAAFLQQTDAAAAATEIRKSPLTAGQTPASAAISAIKNNVRNWAEQYQQETAGNE